MVQGVADGVVRAIRAAFPEIGRVYLEEVVKGVQKPCFIVTLEKPSEMPLLGCRFRRCNPVVVRFLPAGKTDVRADCYDAEERLFRALEYIQTADGLLRGVERKGELDDGALVFSVRYFCFGRVLEEKVLMGDLAVEQDSGEKAF